MGKERRQMPFVNCMFNGTVYALGEETGWIVSLQAYIFGLNRKEKFMQIFKKTCFMLKLFLCVLFFSMVVNSTSRAEVVIENTKQTVYLKSSDVGTDAAEHHTDFYIRLSDGDSIDKTSIRSDNEWVTGKMEYIAEEWREHNFLCIYPRFPGTANILFEDQKGRAYTATATVLPYENPIKSIKITNIGKGKNLAGKVDKSNQYTQKTLLFSKKTSAPKLTLKAAKNWNIISMSVVVEKANGQWAYTLDRKNMNVQSKTMKLKKVDKGYLLVLKISLKNVKNEAEQHIQLGYIPYRG